MKHEDWKAFTELISRVYRLYQRPPLEVEDMRLFFDALADLPFEAVAEGVKRHMRACTGEAGRYAPTPASICLALFGTPEMRAGAAWACVKSTLRSYSLYDSLKFDDPKIHYALQACGGWTGLCNATVDMEPRFRRAYLAAVQREVGWKDVPEHFSGLAEQNGYQLWTRENIVTVETGAIPSTPNMLRLASGE